MKLKANIPYEVEIGEDEQKRICLAYLYNTFNWKSTYSIIDEKVHEKVTKYHHSKSWYEHEYVRDATDDDYNIASIISKL